MMPGREHILLQRINSAALDTFIALREWEGAYEGLMGLMQLYSAAYPLVSGFPPVEERGYARVIVGAPVSQAGTCQNDGAQNRWRSNHSHACFEPGGPSGTQACPCRCNVSHGS